MYNVEACFALGSPNAARFSMLSGRPGEYLGPWTELASAAMLRWTVLQIHDALGREANRVLSGSTGLPG
jgi:hypothetical protein